MEDNQTFRGTSAAYWHQGLDICSEMDMEAVDMLQKGNTGAYVDIMRKYAGNVHSPVDRTFQVGYIIIHMTFLIITSSAVQSNLIPTAHFFGLKEVYLRK